MDTDIKRYEELANKIFPGLQMFVLDVSLPDIVASAASWCEAFVALYNLRRA